MLGNINIYGIHIWDSLLSRYNICTTRTDLASSNLSRFSLCSKTSVSKTEEGSASLSNLTKPLTVRYNGLPLINTKANWRALLNYISKKCQLVLCVIQLPTERFESVTAVERCGGMVKIHYRKCRYRKRNIFCGAMFIERGSIFLYLV